MELKKFEAPTLAQALQVVKRELGPEAVILSTKNKRSALGLMNRSSVEVTAAISPEALDRKQNAEKSMTESQKSRVNQMPSQKVIQAYDILSGSRLSRRLEAEVASSKDLLEKKRQSSGVKAATPTQRRYIEISDDDSPAEQISSAQVDRTSLRTESRFEAPRVQVQPRQQAAPFASSSAKASPVLPQLLSELLDAGVDQDLIKELGDELKVIMLREHITREDILRLQLARVLMSRIRVARPLSERLRIPGTPRVITFVGPTGVGKTTTVAKIAAELVINQKRPVTLATTDTFKIAAVEQLQTYANILRIPLEVCPSAESLEQLNLQAGPEEVILVDTAGFGPRDEKKLRELSSILSGVRTETHLCLSATTRDRDLVESVRRFKAFEPDYLVITKIDETLAHGNIFNVGVRSTLPMSYLTMGQRVPEDIEVATRERLADLILNVSGGV